MPTFGPKVPTHFVKRFTDLAITSQECPEKPCAYRALWATNIHLHLVAGLDNIDAILIRGEYINLVQLNILAATNPIRYCPDTRLRFSLLHEVGHLVLHGDAPVYMAGLRYESIEEREANRFAAEFLMPAPLIEQRWHDGDSFDAIRTRLHVSKRALDLRLQELGLIERKADRPRHEERRHIIADSAVAL